MVRRPQRSDGGLHVREVEDRSELLGPTDVGMQDIVTMLIRHFDIQPGLDKRPRGL
jgi:hypothetical protein